MLFLVSLCVFLLIPGLFMSQSGGLVEAMGRDSTLTGRTALWSQLLRVQVDPLFGTGFESFWLGHRVERLWSIYWWHPNQAHNGYLEIFLNLGWTGILLFGAVAAWGSRNIAAAFCRDPELGRIRLVFFVVAIVYNFTEAAFKGIHLVGIVFLLAATVGPSRRRTGND
jgi:O-antigen ligase